MCFWWWKMLVLHELIHLNYRRTVFIFSRKHVDTISPQHVLWQNWKQYVSRQVGQIISSSETHFVVVVSKPVKSKIPFFSLFYWFLTDSLRWVSNLKEHSIWALSHCFLKWCNSRKSRSWKSGMLNMDLPGFAWTWQVL